MKKSKIDEIIVISLGLSIVIFTLMIAYQATIYRDGTMLLISFITMVLGLCVYHYGKYFYYDLELKQPKEDENDKK